MFDIPLKGDDGIIPMVNVIVNNENVEMHSKKQEKLLCLNMRIKKGEKWECRWKVKVWGAHKF